MRKRAFFATGLLEAVMVCPKHYDTDKFYSLFRVLNRVGQRFDFNTSNRLHTVTTRQFFRWGNHIILN